MDQTTNPEVFSLLLAISRNTKDEQTVLFATIEEKPKVYELNIEDLSIKVIGRVCID